MYENKIAHLQFLPINLVHLRPTIYTFEKLLLIHADNPVAKGDINRVIRNGKANDLCMLYGRTVAKTVCILNSRAFYSRN